jgi:hypothetical protein
VQEKQSSRPPARCRRELHDREKSDSNATLTKRITVPSPSRGCPSGKSDRTASIHRKVNGMNARYRK